MRLPLPLQRWKLPWPRESDEEVSALASSEDVLNERSHQLQVALAAERQAVRRIGQRLKPLRVPKYLAFLRFKQGY